MSSAHCYPVPVAFRAVPPPFRGTLPSMLLPGCSPEGAQPAERSEPLKTSTFAHSTTRNAERNAPERPPERSRNGAFDHESRRC
jgi:hypothetical protein